jgi:hypothetical protein
VRGCSPRVKNPHLAVRRKYIGQLDRTLSDDLEKRDERVNSFAPSERSVITLLVAIG